jgi:hypothetical protein
MTVDGRAGDRGVGQSNLFARARPDRRATPDRVMPTDDRERIPVPANMAPVFGPTALHNGTAGTYATSGIFRVCNIVADSAHSKANTPGIEEIRAATIMP